MKHSKLLIISILGLILSGTSFAQQIDPPSMDLTTELQRALEVDSVVPDLQGIVVLCANACEEKSTKVRKPMQDVKTATSPRDAASGMPTGRRDAASGMPTGRRDAASGMPTGRRDATSGISTGKRDAVSGLPTGKREHKPVTLDKRIDKATPRMADMNALECTGAANCVDMIARNKLCKIGTVSCTGAGCTCEKL